MNEERFCMEYKELEDFLISELKKLEKGQLSGWCKDHGFPRAEVSRFRSRKLRTTRPFFMQDLLKAFGYSDIEIIPKTYFHFKKESQPFVPPAEDVK